MNGDCSLLISVLILHSVDAFVLQVQSCDHAMAVFSDVENCVTFIDCKVDLRSILR